MSQLTDNLTVTSVQTKKALVKAFAKKRPAFLWGPPGIGKSELVAEICNDMGGHMIDLRMAQMEPTDIRGIPFFNKEFGYKTRGSGHNFNLSLSLKTCIGRDIRIHIPT